MKNIKYVLLILPFICLTSCSSFGTKNLKDVYKDYDNEKLMKDVQNVIMVEII